MTNEDYQKQLRRKNWIMLGLLLFTIVIFYCLSFLKFSEAVYS